MKPLGFTLEEMRDLLQILDDLATAHGDERTALRDRLAMFHTAVQERVQALRDQLATAEGFAQQIRDHIDLHHHRHPTPRTGDDTEDPPARQCGGSDGTGRVSAPDPDWVDATRPAECLTT